MVDPSSLGEFVMPEAANKGVGASLSGEVRVTANLK